MKFLLYISLFLSLMLCVMGVILTKIYNHFIFTIYIIFGLVLFSLILKVIIDD